MEKFRHTANLPQPINMFKKSLKKIGNEYENV